MSCHLSIVPLLVLTLPQVLACTSSNPADSGESAAPQTDYAAPGPYAVGRSTLSLDDAERPLTVELWFPTSVAGDGTALPDLGTDAGQQATLAQLLDEAPEDCPTRQLSASLDLPPVDGPLPMILFSHCHTCTRFSGATVAEQLASQGWLVAAPDHAGNTLWELLEGTELQVDDETLTLRRDDLGRVLDAALDGTLGVEVDAAHLGVMGHSFGSVTAGAVLQDRAELLAGLFMGAPIDSPLLDGAQAEALERPSLFLLLQEDNSITTLGNDLIRSNYEAVAGPSWLVELSDAGHWSVSDLVGLVDDFMPGCGEDQRMTDGSDFQYLDPALGRSTTAAVAAAFMADAVLGQEGAASWLEEQGAGELLTVSRR